MPQRKAWQRHSQSGTLLYLDLPEHLDALPDIGLVALEHVRVPCRQSLQRVLQRSQTESAQPRQDKQSKNSPNERTVNGKPPNPQQNSSGKPHLNRLHEVGLVLGAELCISKSIRNRRHTKATVTTREEEGELRTNPRRWGWRRRGQRGRRRPSRSSWLRQRRGEIQRSHAV